MANTITSFDEAAALNAYAITDKVIRSGARAIIRRFNRMRTKAHTIGDLYPMLEIVYGCYEDAWLYYVSSLEQTYRRVYLSLLPRGQPISQVQQFLSGYAMPEGYVPRAEWERKRARCYESVVAAINAGMTPDKAIDTARNLAVRQMQQGCDDMTVAAILAAYADAGIETVMLVAQRDDRVCHTCLKRDGTVYPIDEAPSLPFHYRCRCVYVPFTSNE